MAAISEALARRDPIYRAARHTFYLAPLSAESTREVRPMLLALLAGVIVVLVVTCVNVGGLLLARAAGRQREIATLAALGADRARLARQFLIEGMILASAGALAGLATAMLVLRAIVALRPPNLDRLQHASIDPHVIAVVAAVAGVWGLLFALAPLAEVRRLDISAGLGLQARVSGRLRYRTRAALVITQMALGTVLVVGAGLLLRSIDAVYRVDPGFNLETNALTFRVAWPAHRYATGDEVNAFDRELATRLRALPGVLQVGSISHVPFDSVGATSGKYVTQAEDTPEGQAAARFADMRVVSPGTLELLGLRLVAGRSFTEEDGRGGAYASIVDETAGRACVAWTAGRRTAAAPAAGNRSPGLRMLDHRRRRRASRPLPLAGCGRAGAGLCAVPTDAARGRHVVRRAHGDRTVAINRPGDARRRRSRSAPAAVRRAAAAGLRHAREQRPPLHRRPRLVVRLPCIDARRRRARGTGELLRDLARPRVRRAPGARRHAARRAAARADRGARCSSSRAWRSAWWPRAGRRTPSVRCSSRVSPLDPLSYAGAIVLLGLASIAASWGPARRAAGVNPIVALRAD